VPSPAAAAPKVRSLVPREHGAYGQLGVPLATGLALGRPGLAALALATAAALAFFAHEPLLVLAGNRGPRVRAEHGRRAWRRAIALGLAALALAALGLTRAGPAVWWAAAIAGALALAVAVHVVLGVEKTLVGEVVAAATLAAASVPVAIAGRVAPTTAWAAWAAWAVGFAAITAAVRDVIARGKRRRRGWGLALLVAVIGGAAALAWRWRAQPPVWCAAPLVAVAIGLVVAPAAPRRLRQTGWLLVAASVATAAWLVLAARA